MESILKDALSNVPDVFFVTGVPRSGTTWMQRMLNAHPDIGCFGEADVGRKFFHIIEMAFHEYNDHCGSGNPEKNLPINGFSADRRHDLLRLSFFALVEANLDGALRSFKAIGEKSTDSVEILPSLHVLFPNARFIHVIRDGRDAAVSGWWKFAHGKDGVDVDINQYAGMYADAWDTRIRKAKMDASHFPEVYREVRYEKLISDSHETMSGILDFLGVSSAPTDIEKCLEAGRFENLSGGRKTGTVDTASHFRKGVVGTWEEELSSQGVSAFLARAGDLLKELGYAS